MVNVVLTGGSSGLGYEIMKRMSRVDAPCAFSVYNLSYNGAPEYESRTDSKFAHKNIVCDVSDSESVKNAVKDIDSVDVLINCAGVNGIEFIELMDESLWDTVMDTNAKGLFLVSQALLPQLKKSKGTIVNIISNASHIPMTSSLAYNASKGAAHIMTKQMARELTKLHDITVFGIAPNKMKNTRMSNYIDDKVVELRGWTKEYAQEYQRNSLPAKKETDPFRVAELLCWLLAEKERHDYLTGCIIPVGA